MSNLKLKSGRTSILWLFILVMIGSLLWLLRQLNDGRVEADGCETNLLKLYEVLELYELENGVLPSLAMFPKDARQDPDSLLTVLSAYGVDETMTVCPAAPEVVREHGISYLWNPRVNGTVLRDRAEATWLLVDLQALGNNVPGPHFGNVLILYTDGTVEHSSMPPHSLPVDYGQEGSP